MKKYLSELLGTFALVFCGTGAIVINEVSNGIITHIGIAICFGLVVMSMIYTFGDKSGAHLNPAVTIAFAIHKVFPVKEILPYLISQLGGAFCATLILRLLFPTSLSLGATMPSGGDWQSFVLEIILTFILMMTILNVAGGGKEKGLFAGIAIGSVILLEAMFAGPISGASMNPARSLSPAIISGNLQHLWIYLTAPFIGSIGAVFTNRLIN